MILREIKQQIIFDQFCSIDETVRAVQNYCPNNFNNHNWFFRKEQESSADADRQCAYLLDPSTAQRKPIYDETFGTALAELLAQFDIPNRLHSIIGTTGRPSDSYVVIPFDNTVLGAVKHDFNLITWPGIKQHWDVLSSTPSDLLMRAMHAVSDTLQFRQKYSGSLNSFVKISSLIEFLDFIDYMISQYKEGKIDDPLALNEIEKIIPTSNLSFKQAFMQAINPKTNEEILKRIFGFQLNRMTSEQWEVWTESKCLMFSPHMLDDVYEKFHANK